MIAVQTYLDARRAKCDSQRMPVKIRLTGGRQSTFMGTGVSVAQREWDVNCGCVVNCPQARVLNLKLANMVKDVQAKLFEHELKNELEGLDVVTIRKLIEVELGYKDVNEVASMRNRAVAKVCGVFENFFVEVIEKKEAENTRISYRYTLNMVGRYMESMGKCVADLSFEDVTVKWLEGFDKWMMDCSPKKNARNVHFRNLRNVFNLALDEELTRCYPFRKFKHKTEETRHRALSVDDIRLLWNFEVQGYQVFWLDMFKLVFYLGGINVVDLYGLSAGDYSGGRICYRRAKTGKLYDIKVEPEAAEIIERYRGEKKLLCIADRYETSKSFTHRFNRVLKEIGVTRMGKHGKRVLVRALFPDISVYWARHSVATLMAELDVPNEVIADVLGHSYGNRTTAIYIKKNQRKMDDAMRRVIDLVTGV